MPSEPTAGEHHRTSVEINGVPIGFDDDWTDLGADGASRERVGVLKREIGQQKTYDVDAGAVADAIVAKMRLVRQGRRALDASAVDRSLTRGEMPRQAR